MYLPIVVTPIITAIFTFILLKLLIRYSVKLKLVDVPNERKLHKMPIPSIGGLVIILALTISVAIMPTLQTLVLQYTPLFSCLMVLCLLGVIDDRLNISSTLRFCVEVCCAYVLANNGIKLTSLYGILGITVMPTALQYVITIFIVVGVTNAFNLIDGIDGLAGTLALINLLVLSVMAYLLNETGWLVFLIAFSSSILVFLKYNWQPAKLFMGDGGSLVIGFFTASLGLLFINKVGIVNPTKTPQLIVASIASLIIPVIDTIRVFYARVKMRKSPFSADKNHLHHWFIKNHLLHKQATLKIAILHIFLLLLSIVSIHFVSITATFIILVVCVITYTKVLQLSAYFHRWYKFIKRAEYSS